MQYLSLFSFVSTLLTVVKVYGWQWWTIFLIVPIFILMYYLDPSILKNEQKYFNDNNQAMQDILDNQKELGEKLDSLIKLLSEKK